MSDYSRTPNRVTTPGEVAVTGARLSRLERTLYGITSRTLRVCYNGGALAIDTFGGGAAVDLSARPYYVQYAAGAWTVGPGRAAIPAVYIIGPWTVVDDEPDDANLLDIADDGTLHLLAYRLQVTWAGIGIVETLATLQATALADLANLQEQNAVVWPLAWVRRQPGASPVVVAQIEQGYVVHIPAVTVAQYPQAE